MLNSQSMKEKIANNFKETVILKEGLLRCTREHSGKEISYYYIDHTQDIPKSEVELKKYQDETIGVDYFSHSGEVQWNFYLLFVLDKNTYEVIKDESIVKEIESNKQYTRKFILPLEEVNDFFDFNFIQSNSDSNLSTDLTTRWIEVLSSSGLNEIYGQINRAQVMRNYLSGNQANEEINTITEVNSSELGRQISNLRLINHRAYPTKRDFEFKKMNLFVGPNGVGKTSLMEAIELIYCGGTLRGEGKTDLNSTIHFRYKDHNDFESFSANDNAKYQMRELLWYGKSVTRGNRLYENFNKYNFFNTDSAFQFSHDSSAAEIDVAFSALALGERANYIDKRLRDFCDDFKDKKNAQDKIVKAIEKEIVDKELLIKQFSNIDSNSNQIYSFVLKQAEKLNILNIFPPNSKDHSGNNGGQFLNVIYSVSQIIENGKWLVPLTLNNVNSVKDKYLNVKELITSYENQVSQNKNELLHLENSKKMLGEELSRYKRLSDYYQNETYANYVVAHNVLPSLQHEINFIKNILQSVEEIDFEVLNQLNVKSSIVELKNSTLKDFENINEEIRRLNTLLERERAKNSLNTKLLVEIRSLSKQLVHLDAGITKCPVCDHLYELGQLQKLVLAAVDSDAAFDYSYILKELNEKNEIGKLIEVRKNHLLTLCEIIDRLRDKDIIISTIEMFQAQVLKYENEILILESKLKDNNLVVKDFNEHGFSSLEYNTLLQLLSLSTENISLSFLKEKELAAGEQFEKNNVLEQKLKNQISKILLDKSSLMLSIGMDENEESKDLDLKINSLEFVLKEYEKICDHIKIQDNTDISQLLIELQEVQKTVASFLIAQTSEVSKNIELLQTQEKLKQLSTNLIESKGVFEKLEKAFNVINDLLLNDGKEKALSDFIGKNRTLINSIFTRIHSPNEFQGLLPGTTSLIRKSANLETPLNQVSTGQRAALAISVFLALNLSLKSAPPVILIDDPVAHIDDMNTLSFLDFLREVVIKSDRQVFFATASQKLASLIEKKFSFLDEDFKRYDLAR